MIPARRRFLGAAVIAALALMFMAGFYTGEVVTNQDWRRFLATTKLTQPPPHNVDEWVLVVTFYGGGFSLPGFRDDSCWKAADQYKTVKGVESAACWLPSMIYPKP